MGVAFHPADAKAAVNGHAGGLRVPPSPGLRTSSSFPGANLASAVAAHVMVNADAAASSAAAAATSDDADDVIMDVVLRIRCLL